jgi:hypothetical protein
MLVAESPARYLPLAGRPLRGRRPANPRRRPGDRGMMGTTRKGTQGAASIVDAAMALWGHPGRPDRALPTRFHESDTVSTRNFKDGARGRPSLSIIRFWRVSRLPVRYPHGTGQSEGLSIILPTSGVEERKEYRHMTIALTCPHCGKLGSTSAVLAPGSKVRCPSCQQPFRVPAAQDSDSRDGVIDPPSLSDDDAPSHAPPIPGTPTRAPAPTSPGQTSVSATPPMTAIPHQFRSPGRPPTLKSILFHVLAIVFFLAGFGATMGWGSYSSYDHRFLNDNAYGATANSLESISRQLERSRPEGWYIAGLLCCLVISVDKLRDESSMR